MRPFGRWLAARQRELLPIPYFHVVFTLPHALNALAQGNPRVIYTQLFRAVADTLLTFGRDPRQLGGLIGVTAGNLPDGTQLINNVTLLAKVAKEFNVPAVLTLLAEERHHPRPHGRLGGPLVSPGHGLPWDPHGGCEEDGGGSADLLHREADRDGVGHGLDEPGHILDREGEPGEEKHGHHGEG
jgi:hypothetical protein